ncbi:MAG: TetR/AcrR family transcriptional regulator [Dehalococcoidia bacterium]|nr:TetR/AcrR family transcriptional regulator [Dehalococcoidia bacterium]MDD5493850.1 TetR/AcrR family transcriptional regulator [Dehalococcoidia bacterium]
MVEKKEKTGFRQKQIADAAAELILKYGSEHVTIKRLAMETNLSEAAIYRHFNSKSDIFHFLLKHVESTLLADLDQSNLKDAVKPLGLDELIDRHISHIENSHGVAFQVIAEIISMGDSALNQDTLNTINSYIQSMSQVFRRGKMRNAGTMAIIFFTLIQGLVNLWALGGYAFNLKERFYRVWTVGNKTLLAA